MSEVSRESRWRKGWLALECAGLFVGVPAVIAAGWLRFLVIPLLVALAVGCWLTLRWRHHIRGSDLFQFTAPPGEWRRILLLYALAVPFLAGLLWLVNPALLFVLWQRHFPIWLIVMFAYPVLSVFPQELIYRAFFFERYQPLFGAGAGMVAASAAVFGFGHIIFHNWIAVALTLVGGALFATTYRHTKSLLVVSIEHALYGCAIFTVGLGAYFYAGTLHLFDR